MQIKLLGFVNEYNMKIKQLRAKAFYAFYNCQYQCYSNESASQCLSLCKDSLDCFMSQSNKIYNLEVSNVFVSPQMFPNHPDLPNALKVRDFAKSELARQWTQTNQIFDRCLGPYLVEPTASNVQ